MGLLLASEDYGFILKMKIAKVSNPTQREQKRPRMSSNVFDLKNIASLKCGARIHKNSFNYWEKKDT